MFWTGRSPNMPYSTEGMRVYTETPSPYLYLQVDKLYGLFTLGEKYVTKG